MMVADIFITSIIDHTLPLQSPPLKTSAAS